MKTLLILTVLLFCAAVWSATHVFWYRAGINGYDISTCSGSGKGPRSVCQ